MKFFEKQRIHLSISFAIFILLVLISSSIIDFDWWFLFRDLQKVVDRMISLYFPPNMDEIFKLIDAMWITVLSTLAASVLGTILAFMSALVISKKTSKNLVLSMVIRLIATFMRNIPTGIWALMLLMGFWSGQFLAFMVLTIGTYGFLTRTLADSIDEANTDAIEALKATGASHWQIILHAVIPETFPTMISWILYSTETLIRSSTLIGILTGAGIGAMVGLYKHFRHFDSITTSVFVMVSAILIFDQISFQIRKRLLS